MYIRLIETSIKDGYNLLSRGKMFEESAHIYNRGEHNRLYCTGSRGGPGRHSIIVASDPAVVFIGFGDSAIPGNTVKHYC